MFGNLYKNNPLNSNIYSTVYNTTKKVKVIKVINLTNLARL